MAKDLTESMYVIVTEEEYVYGPFSSREDAQRHSETLRHQVSGNLPRITITNEQKYVNFAESDERCKAYMKGLKIDSDTTGLVNTSGLVEGTGSVNPKKYTISKNEDCILITVAKEVASEEELIKVLAAAFQEAWGEKSIQK